MALLDRPRHLSRCRLSGVTVTWLAQGHADEHRDALAATAGGQGFGRHAKAAVEVLPVVHHPHIARRSNGEIGLHLQSTADIAARRADLVAGLETRRTVLGGRGAEKKEKIMRRSEVRKKKN